MKLVALDTLLIEVNHRGDWLHVILTDDEGQTGYGEASHGGFGPDRDAIVETILTRQCWPMLKGEDPREVARLTSRLWSLANGLAAATAVSACEQALWDLAGQAAGVPVATLFGRSTDREIPLYANINRAVTVRTPNGFAAAARAAVGDGYQAAKSRRLTASISGGYATGGNVHGCTAASSALPPSVMRLATGSM